MTKALIDPVFYFARPRSTGDIYYSTEFSTIDPTGVVVNGVSGIFIPYYNLNLVQYWGDGWDIREIAHGFLENLSDAYFSIPTTGLVTNGSDETADLYNLPSGTYVRPTQMTVSKSQSLSQNDIITKSYTISFSCSLEHPAPSTYNGISLPPGYGIDDRNYVKDRCKHRVQSETAVSGTYPPIAT